MLAKGLHSSHLGSVCGSHAIANSGLDAFHDTDGGSGDAAPHHAGRHCDLCASLGWALPPLPVAAIPCLAGEQVAAADFPADVVTSNPGLPFSRGPPALLI
jgi:hypothetical protein